MNIYQVSLLGTVVTVRATRAALAACRAMDRFKESSLCSGVNVEVVKVGRVEVEYKLRGSVACDPPGSFKSEDLAGYNFKTKREAEKVAQMLNASAAQVNEPKIKTIRVVRREKA